MTDSALAERLLATVARRGRPVAADDLLRAARVSRGERSEARAVLDELEASGRLVRTKSGRLTLPEALDLVAGRLEVKPSGFAFCVPDDPQAQHLQLFVDAPHPADPQRRWRTVRSPVSFDGERALAVTAPPLLGDHNDAMNSEAGPWTPRP